MATIATKMTVAEYEKIPPLPGERWELRHGELVKVEFPNKGHYDAQRKLEKLLQATGGGKYAAGIEMAFRPLAEHELWGADVGVVSLARWEGIPMTIGSPDRRRS